MLMDRWVESAQATRAGVNPEKVVLTTAEVSDVSDDRVAALEAEVEQLRQAAVSRQRIGVAVGLLAARFRCSSEQSWQILARLSKSTNIKVRVLAEVLIAVQEGRVAEHDAEILQKLDQQLPPHWRAGWPELVLNSPSA